MVFSEEEIALKKKGGDTLESGSVEQEGLAEKINWHAGPFSCPLPRGLISFEVFLL